MVGQQMGTGHLSSARVRQPDDLVDVDRQCAWELYVEMATRVAVTGKVTDPTGRDFAGEVLAESLTSLYAFFRETRQLMRRLPVGKLGAQAEGDLGALVLHRAILAKLRPFLERWQADWTRLRLALRSLQGQLVQAYGFVNLDAGSFSPRPA